MELGVFTNSSQANSPRSTSEIAEENNLGHSTFHHTRFKGVRGGGTFVSNNWKFRF